MWELIRTDRITREMLAGLLNNEIAAVSIQNFISHETCRLALQGVLTHKMEYYKNIQPPIAKIGITQYEHMTSSELKLDYFQRAPLASATRQEVFCHSGDLLAQLILYLKEVWGQHVDIAVEEETGQLYFAGLVRVINVSLLHRDWAPKDARGWSVGNVSAQISWNIYLQVSEEGGATIIYRRPWREEDEELKLMPNNCAFQGCMVAGCESVEVLPEAGELILFNSRNYHEVARTGGPTDRITVSSFIGLTEDGSLVFWS